MCGGGSRWREEQAEVLDFAEKLHYDHSPGGSLISETDDKGKWVDWRDDFGRWKDKNVAKEDSGQAWWQTYEAPSESHSGGGGGGGGGSPADPGAGIGPYPLSNRYFPQLTHAYETPQAQDWSQYGLLDPNYQPWTEQGGQQYVPDNVWNYAPPEINRGPVQYAGPPAGGLMHVAAHGPSSGKKPPMTLQEMIESGLYDGNPGYGPEGEGMVSFANSPWGQTDWGKLAVSQGFGSMPAPEGSYGTGDPEPGEVGYGLYGASMAEQGLNASTGTAYDDS